MAFKRGEPRVCAMVVVPTPEEEDRLRAKARERLDELRTGDGRPIPGRMKAEIRRELERLNLLRTDGGYGGLGALPSGTPLGGGGRGVGRGLGAKL